MQGVRQGERLLEKAVLEVLAKAKQAGEELSATEIGIRTGIFNVDKKQNPTIRLATKYSHPTTYGILNKLIVNRQVEKYGNAKYKLV